MCETHTTPIYSDSTAFRTVKQVGSSFSVSRNPNTFSGLLFEKSVESVFWGEEFPEKKFNNVVRFFKTESGVNSNGVYNKEKYPLGRANQSEYLLKNLYLLIK